LVEEPKRKVDICYLIDHLKKFHKFWTSRRPPFWISKCERVKINGNSNRAEGPLVSYTGRLTARPGHCGRTRDHVAMASHRLSTPVAATFYRLQSRAQLARHPSLIPFSTLSSSLCRLLPNRTRAEAAAAPTLAALLALGRRRLRPPSDPAGTSPSTPSAP
jgi:hypothetical protein